MIVRGAGTFATLLALGLLAAGLAGCGASFDSPTLLSKLRLLALQAAPVNPAQGETTTITPLVYSPSDAPLEFSWSWCPLLGQANDGYVCPIAYDDASAMLAAAGVTDAPARLRSGRGPDGVLHQPVSARRAGRALRRRLRRAAARLHERLPDPRARCA